jgi:acyl carrier protein
LAPADQPEEEQMSKEAVESIEDAVKSIIVAELRVDRNHLGPTTHLMKDLGADSLDALNIALRLEEQFKIKIPDDAIPKFLTVGDIVHGVNEHLSAQ